MSQRCVTKQGASFVWTTLCQEAFDTLKDRLVSSPVLAYPCFTKPFVLHTDASGVGLGAVLEQEQDDGKLHPISYASRTLSMKVGTGSLISKLLGLCGHASTTVLTC